MIGVLIPAVPRSEKYSGFIFGMNFCTLSIITTLETELSHSFATRFIKSAFMRSFFALPVTTSANFEINVSTFPTYPEYVSGLGTGTAFGPTSLLPSDLKIQCGSKNGKFGSFETEKIFDLTISVYYFCSIHFFLL